MDAPVNPFTYFWQLGYRTLLPVIPPNATLDEKSFMARTNGDGYLGKAPGIKWASGAWGGFAKWQHHVATEDDLARWFDMRASVGYRLDDGDVAIDIDGSDPAVVDSIEAAALSILGPSPSRVGRSPRRMLFFRLPTPIPYRCMRFQGPDGVEKVEILSAGRQVVIQGVHPKTGKRYGWPRGPVPHDELTRITVEQLDEFFEWMRANLPAAAETAENEAADREHVDQATLLGNADLIRSAVDALPNNRDMFPDREDYIRVGAAIKAAVPDDGDAFDIWCAWAAKDEGGKPEFWEKDWKGLKPPFEIGSDFLYMLATKLGNWQGWKQAIVDRYYEEIPDAPESVFPTDPPAANESLYEVLTVDALFNRPDPKFLIDRHVPEASVGFLYGDPGTGKSFIALDWALHLAFDRDNWHGDALQPAPGAAVIYLAGEGASGFKTRVSAWMQRHGVPHDQSGRFGLIHQSVNFMQPDDVKRLVRTLRQSVRIPVAAVVVDTVSRAMPGADENLQKEMTLFVKACDIVKDAFKCAVIGVHHAGKSGDMRGSTVLRGAGDFVFKLERKKGHSVGHLHCEKQKDAPDGWSEAYRFDVVNVGVDAAGKVLSSLVPTRCESGAAEASTLTPALSDEVLTAMRDAWNDGEPWSTNYRSGDRMAARKMVKDFGFDMEGAESVLAVWLGTGTIVEDIVSKKDKRKGLRVVLEGVAKEDENVFE